MTADLVRYSVPDLTGLSLREAWDLEDSLAGAGEVLGAHIDEEIRRLVGEGWTQARIAEECGRSQSTVSYRMNVRGLRPAAPEGRTGRPRLIESDKSPEAPESDGSVGARRLAAARQLVSGVTEKANHIAAVQQFVDPNAIKALPEEDKEQWKRQLADGRLVITRILGAL